MHLGYRVRWAALLAVFSLSSLCSAAIYPDSLPLIGSFRNTYYYSVQESEFAAHPNDTPVLSMQDLVLVTVSSIFMKKTDLEGSGKLRDGRVLNFAGVKAGKIRYRFTVHPHGVGVGDCELIPFHSIAIDMKGQIPPGSTVLIDETVGMQLPDGSTHDGLWKAEDTGSAIQKDRIDLFVGDGDNGKVLDRAGISHLQALHVRLVSPSPSNSCIHQSPQ